MRIALVDLKGRDGFVSKDTVAGGYGSRLRPFSKVTHVVCQLKRRFHDLPSVHLAYIAAIAADAGHDVVMSSGDPVDADTAIVVSSLVDYRQERAWAEAARRRGVRVGFVGLAASRLPHLFDDAADFVVVGEPEAAIQRLVAGEMLAGRVHSADIRDLDSLPFPRWDLVTEPRRRLRVPFAGRPVGGTVPLLASRSCPEFCTYCPHRILSTYRVRGVESILEELERITRTFDRPHVVFRDPLFSEDRDRVVALCAGIRTRGLALTFECETRLDRLDTELVTLMHRAGLRAMSFGVEAQSADVLTRVGRRPIPEARQRAIVEHCRKLGVVTAAFYVFGFPTDDWASVNASIDYAVQLGSTVAQFKILTPYPGTPLFRRMESTITERDWERFDGFTPTFDHPTLGSRQLRFLLGSAYTRFYMRPSFLANYLRWTKPRIRQVVSRLDARVDRMHARRALAFAPKVL